MQKNAYLKNKVALNADKIILRVIQIVAIAGSLELWGTSITTTH